MGVLDQTELMLDEDDLARSLCTDHFFSFVEEFWETIIPEEPVFNWHIEYLCDELQTAAFRVRDGLPRAYDLICNISPGTTKSTIWSVLYNPWVWTFMPQARFIGASYASTLALQLAMKSRDVVQSEKYQDMFPHVRLRDDQSAKSNFGNTKGGQRLAVGAGGMITGFHGHFIIIDDPINPEDAMKLSAKDLSRVNRWMITTLGSRKVDKKSTFTGLVMQRLHQNDPTAYKIEQSQKKTSTGEDAVPLRIICLPAERTDKIQPPELEDHYVDGLMDPVRLSRDVLEEVKATSDYVYSGQYLQDPIPLGGGLFKTERLIIDEPPTEFKRVAWFIDKASLDDNGDWTVMAKLAEDFQETKIGELLLGRFWVLNIIRGQWSTDRRETIFRNTLDQDFPYNDAVRNKRYLETVRIGIEEEAGASGKDSARMTIRNLTGYRVEAYKPSGSKAARAEPFATQCNHGNVYLAPGEWNRTYIDELKHFPFSTHDDQVDASSGAFKMLFEPKRVVGAWRRKRK